MTSRLLSLIERAVAEPVSLEPATDATPRKQPRKLKRKQHKQHATPAPNGKASKTKGTKAKAASSSAVVPTLPRKRRKCPARDKIVAALALPSNRDKPSDVLAAELGVACSTVNGVRRELAQSDADDSTDGEPAEKAKPPPIPFNPFLAPRPELPPVRIRKRPGRKPKTVRVPSGRPCDAKNHCSIEQLANRDYDTLTKRQIARLDAVFQKQIAERKAEVQATWRDGEERNRRGLPAVPTDDESVSVPVLPHPDIDR